MEDMPVSDAMYKGHLREVINVIEEAVEEIKEGNPEKATKRLEKFMDRLKQNLED